VEREQLVGDTHGGLIETSQLLALHPDWVDAGHEKLPSMTVNGWREAQGRGRRGTGARSAGNFLGMLSEFRDSLAYFGEQTYAGAPAGASAELGERMLDALGQRAAEATTELLDGTIGPEDCHSPIWKLRFVFLNPLMIRFCNRLLGFRNPII
jgi:creatinine amidohydrolase/Fe(II)-dependent formamide hydrolase-like protein